MSYHTIAVTALTILNGQTDSSILYAQPDFRDGDTLKLYAPGTMPETVKVYVSPVGSPSSPPQASDWRILSTDSGTDTVLSAGHALSLDLPAFKAIKLVAGGAVAADRVIAVTKGVWA